MRRKKLGRYGITLIIFAAIFQLIALSLDQAVIQLEDRYRNVEERNANYLQEKLFALENNRKIGENIRAASFQLFIISALSPYSKESNHDPVKKEYYQKILRSQYLLTKDIIGDSRNDFLCSLTWNVTYFDRTKPEKICDLFHNIGEVNWKIYLGLGGKLKGKDAKLNNPSYENVQYILRFNEVYLNRLLKVFSKKQTQLTEKLKKSNVEIYNINQKKQLFLLFSMIAQLLSFLFLLILFRRILR